MKPNSEGLTKIDRVRMLIEQEILDGCNDCKGTVCDKHIELLYGLSLTPLKYIDMKTMRLKPEYEAQL